MPPSPNSKSNGLLISWVLVLFAIPLLSIYGRLLQRWVVVNLGYNLTAWLIFIAIATALGGLFRHLYKTGRKSALLHMFWVLPLFLGAPLSLGMVEERLHFLVFGAFGALSMALFRPRVAFMLCLAVAAGDEFLQYFLPDRVGDWRDVAMNSIASVAAALFVLAAFLNHRQEGSGD